MAEKKFKLSITEAFNQLWDVMIGEDQDNFTPEYRKDVMDVLREVREAV